MIYPASEIRLKKMWVGIKAGGATQNTPMESYGVILINCGLLFTAMTVVCMHVYTLVCVRLALFKYLYVTVAFSHHWLLQQLLQCQFLSYFNGFCR